MATTKQFQDLLNLFKQQMEENQGLWAVSDTSPADGAKYQWSGMGFSGGFLGTIQEDVLAK